MAQDSITVASTEGVQFIGTVNSNNTNSDLYMYKGTVISNDN